MSFSTNFSMVAAMITRLSWLAADLLVTGPKAAALFAFTLDEAEELEKAGLGIEMGPLILSGDFV